MLDLWAGIDPHATHTRILITHGAQKPLLKARLSRLPRNPRALPTLLEAVALWEGQRIRAAFVVDDAAGSALDRYHACFHDAGGTPLYHLEYVSRAAARRERDPLPGMGRFHDLKQLLLFEVAK